MEKKVKYEVEINLEKDNTYISCNILEAPYDKEQGQTEKTMPMLLFVGQYYGYKNNSQESFRELFLSCDVLAVKIVGVKASMEDVCNLV